MRAAAGGPCLGRAPGFVLRVRHSGRYGRVCQVCGRLRASEGFSFVRSEPPGRRARVRAAVTVHATGRAAGDPGVAEQEGALVRRERAGLVILNQLAG